MIQLNKYYLEDHTPPIPDGKTVLPTDDVQIWLSCAGLKLPYTSLADVLADTVCLDALMADNNAADYLVRSTTWTTMCSNLNAMAAIGTYDYVSNILLDDSTWSDAICDSIYFESVLTASVPKMTSNTAPEGICSASYSGDGQPYLAFDKTDAYWSRYQGDDTFRSCWINYEFVKPVRIVKLGVKPFVSTYCRVRNFTIYGSNDNSTYDSLKSFTSPSTSGMIYYKMTENTNYYKTMRLYLTSSYGYSGAIREIQYYGRWKAEE